MQTASVRSVSLWILVGGLLLAPLAAAVDAEPSAEEKGLAIAREMKARDSGWGDSTATMEMLLYGRSGTPALREMRILTLEVEDDGDKSLIIFDTPRDVRGTAFLSFTHIDKPDDQWLYLPALKRVKRISSKNKTGSFMGSEFAYEDLNSFEVERYRYLWLRDEACGELVCYLVEMTPLDSYSGYSKQLFWIDQEHYRIQRVDYYDRRDTLAKTLELSEYTQYLDVWRALTQSILNHRNKRKSVIQMRDYEFRTGLTEADFTSNSLRRAR